MLKKTKKLIGLSLMLFLSVGCNKPNTEIKNGTEIAKILLANERLDSESLQKDGNIFSKGSEAFAQIKQETIRYSKNTSPISNSFKKEGNLYQWSDAPEYSNFMDYFNSYAINIVGTAERGSALIDSAKKNIKVSNKWIKVGETKTLLLVEENSETIFSTQDNFVEICRRYQNELGLNVFEMYYESMESNYSCRMTYIPGLKYEFVSTDNHLTLVILADNDKGYWDVFSTTQSHEPDSENRPFYFENLVMKDEAIYHTAFTLERENIYYSGVKLITEDGKSDILSFQGNNVSLYTTGMLGVEKFYTYANDDEVYNLTDHNYVFPDDYSKYKVYVVGNGQDAQYYTDGENNPNVKFTNGNELNKGDTFYNGAISVERISVLPIGALDFYGEINLTVNGEGIDSVFSNLSKLTEDLGFSLKGGNEQILDSLKYAVKDSENFSKYYIWQGNHINDFSAVAESYEKERESVYSFKELYESKKDLETINENEQGYFSESIRFTDLTYVEKGNVSNDGFTVSIENLSIKANDTTLFEEGESYKLELAVALLDDNNYQNIIPISAFEQTKVYNGETTFEISGNIDATLPLLEEGTYVLVAYVATQTEGIRVSKPIKIEGNVVSDNLIVEGINNSIYSENNSIYIKSIKESNRQYVLTGNYTYEQLYEIMESYAYKCGLTTNDVLQIKDGSAWVDLNNQKDLNKGTYRLRYVFDNKDAYIEVTLN